MKTSRSNKRDIVIYVLLVVVLLAAMLLANLGPRELLDAGSVYQAF